VFILDFSESTPKCRALLQNTRYCSFFPQSQTEAFCFDPEFPQHEPFSPQQDSVSISFPRSAAPIIAHAQPTPL
jgi:hypothetical protein